MTTVARCPECKQTLQVPLDMIGEQVQCPGCFNIFLARAEPVGAPPPAEPTVPVPAVPEVPVAVAAPPAEPKRPPAPPPAPPPLPTDERIAEWDKRPPKPGEDDEEFASPIEDEPGEAREKKPRKEKKSKEKSSRWSGMYDDLMREQRRKMQPHRGALIFTLGIFGLMCVGIPGVFAWILGTNDLNEMLSGRMDPKGRSLTNTGRILGMVSVGINGAAILIICGSCWIFPMISGLLSQR
jgi:hypothetical protein